ncbi:histidine phosphatase superfamily [Blastocladiella britannica]|nr:histidine phosphatase superfamily [Blastocladiella britannica]
MYSVRRMSTFGGGPPTAASPTSATSSPSSSSAAAAAAIATTMTTAATAGKPPALGKLNTASVASVHGSADLLTEPIPMSARPDTPLVGMPVGMAEAGEPMRDLILNLIVVRHAETDLNVRRPRVVQGQIDTPLNARGMKQAMMVAHRLAHTKVDYVYSSDLARCKQTADEIARFHGKPVHTDMRLREQHLGDLTGQPWSGAKHRIKQADMNYDGYLAAHGGESAAAVRERVVQCYIDVVEKHLLAPNRIALPKEARPAGAQGNKLTEAYGPATPATPSSAIAAGAPSVAAKAHAAASTTFKRLPSRETTVVLVTHGGPIQKLVAHVVADLGFTYLPKVPAGLGRRATRRRNAANKKANNGGANSIVSMPYAPRMTQFPRPGALYHVRLTRRAPRASTDEGYDWTGHVVAFNCTAHLATERKWAVHSMDAPPGATAPALTTQGKPAPPPKTSMAPTPATPGPYRLARIRKEMKKSNSSLVAGADGAGNNKVGGMRAMFGKLSGVISGSPVAQPDGDKRKKSLGW